MNKGLIMKDYASIKPTRQSIKEDLLCAAAHIAAAVAVVAAGALISALYLLI